MFTVQRIYAYRPGPEQTAVFIDRLYPRGIRKEVFATALWLKDITPVQTCAAGIMRIRLNILTVSSAVTMRSCTAIPSKLPLGGSWSWNGNTAAFYC